MVDEPDIWRAANLLVKHHGHEAALVAARRADEAARCAGIEGCKISKRILEAVVDLRRTTPVNGERVN